MPAKKKKENIAACNADYKGHLCTREHHDDGFHSYSVEPESFQTSNAFMNARCEGHFEGSRCQRPLRHSGECKIFRLFNNFPVPDDSLSSEPRILN